MTPGPRTASPSSGSIVVIESSPSVLRTTPPSIATELPVRLLRAPCGTTGVRVSWAQRITSTTSPRSRARTTSKSPGAVAPTDSSVA